MRVRLMLCGLALCCCGSPIDAFVGAYSVLGVSNTLTEKGVTTTASEDVPAGTKLIITHDQTTAGVIIVSLGAREITKASLSTMSGAVTTIVRTDRTNDTDCVYNTTWNAGGVLSLDGSVFTMHRQGSTAVVCSMTPNRSYSGDQIVQATKDK